jgi:hypothetical protein
MIVVTAPAILAGSPLHLKKLGATGRKYELLEPFVYASAVPGVGSFVVPRGYVTDFHSIPWGLWNLLPPDDFAESAIAHDWLYEQGEIVLIGGGTVKITRLQADQVHAEILRLMGAPEWRVKAMYAGLRIGGWKAWGDYRDQDAARRAGVRHR